MFTNFLEKTSLVAWILFFVTLFALCFTLILLFKYRKLTMYSENSANEESSSIQKESVRLEKTEQNDESAKNAPFSESEDLISSARRSEAQLRADVGKAADKLRKARTATAVTFLQNTIQESLRDISIALENSVNRMV